MRARSSRTPAGIPVTMMVSCGPWDSPAVVNVNLDIFLVYPERSEGSPVAPRSANHQKVIKSLTEVIPVWIFFLDERHSFRARPRFNLYLTRGCHCEGWKHFEVDETVKVVSSSKTVRI